MPRVKVTSDDGTVFWDESVNAHDLSGEHFRRCLVDRLSWAVVDAEGHAPMHGRRLQPVPTPEAPRPASAQPVAA
jgi:hypothetical protein